MHRRVLVALALAGVVAAVEPPAAGQSGTPRSFTARLSTVPIDLSMADTVAGSGSVTATLKGRTLAVTGTFKGLKSPATLVRVHRSPNRGIRGPAFADLTTTAATTGDISGSVELTAEQVADLEKGRLYVQLHSEKAPEGNLWGWLEGK